jgi:VTC domain
VPGDLDAAPAQFEGVSLKELDERASLLKRVDSKYSVVRERFLELLERLRADVLDMDGQRVFAYRTTYFDTPDLRCFTDHVEDQHPRFKARTRLYVDSDSCVFEVKLKR